VRPRFFTVTYRREFPVSAARAYAWLTDYQDDDHERAGAIVRKRTVLKREEGLVLLEGHNVTLGTHARGKAEVRLDPAGLRWEARVIEGSARGSVYEYQLSALGPDRCLLVVRYKTRVKRLGRLLVLNVARPAIQREIRQMWDGFEKAMRDELSLA